MNSHCAHTHTCFFQIRELILGWASTLQGPRGACLYAPASKLDHLGRGSQEERWFPRAPGTSVKRTSLPTQDMGLRAGNGLESGSCHFDCSIFHLARSLPGLLGIELSLSRDWEHEETKEFSTICLIQ